MPIYEFHCNKCDQDFEYLILGSDKPECSSCSSRDVSKLMSACSYVSSGGGGGGGASSSASSSCGGCSASSCAGCGH
jgi:putative FmdB family regulatory protein